MTQNNRGISHEVGTILMIAIMVLLVAIWLPIFQGLLTEQEPQEPPYVVPDDQYYVQNDTADPNSGLVYTMELTNQAGENVNRDDVAVRVQSGTIDKRYNLSGGTWEVGDKVELNLTDAGICSAASADNADIQVIHEPTAQPIYQTDTVINKDVNLSVDGNSVTADGPYTADVQIIGIGASSESGGNIQPDYILGRVQYINDSGGATLTPYGDGDPYDAFDNPTNAAPSVADDLNGPDNRAAGEPPYSFTTRTLNESEEVTLEVRSLKPNDWTDTGTDVTRDGTTYDYTKGDRSDGVQASRFWVDSSNTAEGNVEVLTDGADVSTITGLGLSHQRGVKDMLGPRIQGGELNLDDDEAVYLFELTDPSAEFSDADGSGNPDYNDAVGIIDIDPKPQIVETNGDPEIQCG